MHLATERPFLVKKRSDFIQFSIIYYFNERIKYEKNICLTLIVFSSSVLGSCPMMAGVKSKMNKLKNL